MNNVLVAFNSINIKWIDKQIRCWPHKCIQPNLKIISWIYKMNIEIQTKLILIIGSGSEV